MKPITTFLHMRSGRSALLLSGRIALLAGLTVIRLLPAGPAAAQRLPIFDAHIHYSRDAWARFPAAVALKILKRGGVIRAFVSSTPDDGTLRLYRAAPKVVVPVLRPSRYGNTKDLLHVISRTSGNNAPKMPLTVLQVA